MPKLQDYGLWRILLKVYFGDVDNYETVIRYRFSGDGRPSRHRQSGQSGGGDWGAGVYLPMPCACGSHHHHFIIKIKR